MQANVTGIRSRLVRLIRPPVTSSLLDSDVLLGSLFSNTLI
jgi:hypothetical protein